VGVGERLVEAVGDKVEVGLGVGVNVGKLIGLVSITFWVVNVDVRVIKGVCSTPTEQDANGIMMIAKKKRQSLRSTMAPPFYHLL
jgi:hypothetical protein